MEKHVMVWDMDDTLYDCTLARKAYWQSMCDLLAERLGLGSEEARIYAKGLCKQHGVDSSAVALHRTHGWPLEELIELTHGRIDATTCVKAEPDLRTHVTRAGQRRVLFTNSPALYKARVLEALGIADCFPRSVALEQMLPYEKPHMRSFAAVMKLYPHNTGFVLVDDSPKNIAAAHALGWHTVWYQPPWKGPAEWEPPTHRIIKSLAEL